MFAVSDGYVVKVASPTIYLDWGKDSGVKPGDSFSIYRAGAELKHPVTGAVLGQTQEAVGAGNIDSVEDKFSIGRLSENLLNVKAGDRTHYKESPEPPVSQTTPAPAVTAATPAATAPALTRLWQGDPIDAQAMGMAIGDVDGDGQKEVAVAFRNRVEVYRWNGAKLESIGVFKSRNFSHWLAIEAADIEKSGHDRLFVTAFLDGVRRPRVLVLEWNQGQLKEVAHLDGFVRKIPRANGSETLVWLGLSMSREFRLSGPFELQADGKGYKPGPSLGLSRLREDQLAGYALGDWDGDQSEDLAVLERGDHLRLFFKDAKWSTSDVYGGTNNDFSYDEDKVATLYPRLGVTHAATGPDLLIAPHNIPELGIRLTYFKFYKKSEIVSLKWNGLDMIPVWRLPMVGALADYTLGDGLRSGDAQLWVALIGAGDKTVLASYALPK